MDIENIRHGYNDKYRTDNYFRNKRWVYRAFIDALVRKERLNMNTRLLDAGCGQGFFTALFAEKGVNALGIDVSSVAIESAKKTYAGSGAMFEVGDVMMLPYREEFDCLFVRSCSLYNVSNFGGDRSVTDKLISYVRPGGLLIFDYYSRLAPRQHGGDWLYHSIADAKTHFEKYRGAEVYFSLRLETWLLRRLAFSPPASYMNQAISRILGLGGEIIVLAHTAPNGWTAREDKLRRP